jgi:putative intracellular protease/amidase
MNEARPVVVMLLPALDYDPTESAVICEALTASGVDVRFATPDGGPAYADPRLVDKGFSVLSPLLMTRPQSLSAYKRMVNDAHFVKPCTYDDVDIDTADGLFVPGGHAKGVRTLLESAAAQAIATTAMSRDITVGAVCHGVLLLARTPGTAAKLASAFRSREIEKTYWAIVARRPTPAEGRIDLPLKRVGGARGERTAPADRDDKEAARAITDYRTLDHAGQKLAWLELEPLTGRTHQLRVHCVALGAPILGDVKYARPDQNNAFSATVEGLSSELHLHARALRLPHPAGGRLLVEADLPPHMVQTFRTLGFHAPPARLPERR